jgi:hypothetical protein
MMQTCLSFKYSLTKCGLTLDSAGELERQMAIGGTTVLVTRRIEDGVYRRRDSRRQRFTSLFAAVPYARLADAGSAVPTVGGPEDAEQNARLRSQAWKRAVQTARSGLQATIESALDHTG